MVSLAELKTQARLEQDTNDEDGLLSILIVAARRACELHTGKIVVGDEPTIVADDDLAVFAQAVMMLAAHWYANREGAGAGTAAHEMPPAVRGLLEPFREFAV